MESSAPGLDSKLLAAPKKSMFDKQKAEAEAKRARDQAETAAIYDDFVKSFDDGATAEESKGGVQPGKRHFTSNHGGRDSRGLPKSGPGSLGPPKSGPGSLGPPMRKRYVDGSEVRSREREHGLFAYENSAPGSVDVQMGTHTGEEQDSNRSKKAQRPVSKPTVHLAGLPPGLSIAQIKGLLPSSLKIENVRLLPPSTGMERKSQGAIITLAADTPVTEVDAAVSAGQNSYLGRGYYLSLSRHLSSTSVGVGLSLGASSSPTPFGAKPAPSGPVSLGRAPPPRAFAPPSSYHTAANTPPPQLMQVSLRPPKNLQELKTIHKTLEAVHQYGVEFEALLMSRAEVQREEKWAWLWDARSEGGTWYRWRLWEILTKSSSNGRQRGMPAFVFENGAAWVPPKEGLPMEFITELDDVVDDEEYESEDTDDSEDDARRRQAASSANTTGPEVYTREYLTPMKRARLVHMLASLPITTARLRRGDIADLMSFAIKNAGQGGDEIVDLMVENIIHPFAFTSGNPDYRRPRKSAHLGTTGQAGNPNQQTDIEREDSSPASLIALFAISDILSSSSTCGIRHAWRYRSLFEAALLQSRSFYHLGTIDKVMKWGRLRAEKWRRGVLNLLNLWDGWCVFPGKTMDAFRAQFDESGKAAEEEERSKSELQAQSRPVVQLAQASKMDGDTGYAIAEAEDEDLNVDGESMDEEALDGEPMDEGELDGEPIADEDVDGEPLEQYAQVAKPPSSVPLEQATAARPLDEPESPLMDNDDMFGEPKPVVPAASMRASAPRTVATSNSLAQEVLPVKPRSPLGAMSASTDSGPGPGSGTSAAKRKRARASDLF